MIHIFLFKHLIVCFLCHSKYLLMQLLLIVIVKRKKNRNNDYSSQLSSIIIAYHQPFTTFHYHYAIFQHFTNQLKK